MGKGPFGGPRPFSRDNKKVLILIGIDGTEPPVDILMSAEELIWNKLNGLVDEDFTVNLSTSSHPTSEQKQALGGSFIHVQQYEITTELEEISQGVVNAIHNEVIDVLNENGFNITDTRTTVV